MNKIGFIGVGNMGSAMLRGILERGAAAAGDVATYDADARKCAALAEELGVGIAADANALASVCDLIVLAVKPDIAPEVLEELRPALTGEKTVLSVVLGLDIGTISGLAGGRCRVIRCMPNMPALIGAGMMCVSFGSGFNQVEKGRICALLSACGAVEVMEEKYLKRVTSLTGSSPAYVFIMLEAMSDAAVKNGLPRALALRLAAQAVQGSAKMALESGRHPASLKDDVCSPAGSTIEAVRILEERGFRSALIEAMIACDDKSR